MTDSHEANMQDIRNFIFGGVGMDNLKEFEYLWTDAKDKCYLYKHTDGNFIGEYSIIEIRKSQNWDKMILLIEDEDLHKRVVEKMIEENCKIVTNLD